MLALRCAPPVFGAAEAERIARDVYGLAVSVQPLAGERDCNFRASTADGHDYLLKIIDGASDSLTIDCQVSVLRHVAEQDATLPVPRVYPTQQGDEVGRVVQHDVLYATCLMQFLPGISLAEGAADRPLLSRLGATLARVDRALQGFFHPALNQHIAWDVRRLPELSEFVAYVEFDAARIHVQRAIDAIRDSLPALRGFRAQAIHGDYHGGNLLVDAGSVSGILDFGDMIHAPLIVEPAVAMAELAADASNAADLLGATAAILAGYVASQALPASELGALFDLVNARHAATVLVHAWRRRHDPRSARLIDLAAARAESSLAHLSQCGRDAATRAWAAAAAGCEPVPPVDLSRRHRLLGVGAELFYEQPLHLVRGDGVWLYDSLQRAYLDVYNNVPHVGHSHPVVVQAIQRQTALLSTHTRYLHQRILDYAEQLTARCPAQLDACIFVNSGSEANDIAWRMAQFATGERGALIMDNAYHGITEAVAALSPWAGRPLDPRTAVLSSPPPGQRVTDPFPSTALTATLKDAERALSELAARGLAPAAPFLDTALTSSGIFDPPPAWACAVASQIRAAGGLIVADEVQYGFGRSGSHFWGFERRGLIPDIVTLGKPAGNGYPLGVVIAGRSLIEAFQARHGFFSTFGGNAVAAAAGLAVLEVLKREDLMANARATGSYLTDSLRALASRHDCLGEVRGSGLLLGVQVFGSTAEEARKRTHDIVNALARARVLIGYEGPGADILKLRPPMSFHPEHADLLVRAIGAVVAAP